MTAGTEAATIGAPPTTTTASNAIQSLRMAVSSVIERPDGTLPRISRHSPTSVIFDLAASLSITRRADIRCAIKTPWRDGTTQVIFVGKGAGHRLIWLLALTTGSGRSLQLAERSVGAHHVMRSAELT